MSARRKTVPVTIGICAPEFLITSWPAIEKVCKFRTELPKAARDDIQEKTRLYLWLQKMKAEAIPLANQVSDFKKIAKATEELRQRLAPLRDAVAMSIPSDKNIKEALNRNTQASKDAHREKLRRDLDRSLQIMHRLEPCFDEVTTFRSFKLGERRPFRNFAQEMEVLCSLLASLEDAANKAAGKTRDERDLQLKGDAWDRWIAGIYKIVTDYGLPATTSNDTDKRPLATETPFLRLVKELQNLLPDKARRREHSNPALAKAIQRAIEKHRHASKPSAA